MANSDVETPKKLTVADAIVELTADRVVFDTAVLDRVIEAGEAGAKRASMAGAVKTDFPVKYEDYAEGRYDG